MSLGFLDPYSGERDSWANFQENGHTVFIEHVLMSLSECMGDPDRKVTEILENPLKCHHCL